MPAEPVSPIEKVASDGKIALEFFNPTPPGIENPGRVSPWDRIPA
jgi:hypothetical protein